MEVVQWPDRVLLRYEKDDQLRTVWMDGRKPHGQRVQRPGLLGRQATTATRCSSRRRTFAFDITGFDDYNGIPSSQQKIVRERYWRDGHDLRVTVSVEDPMFLRKPTEYTTRWMPTAPRLPALAVRLRSRVGAGVDQVLAAKIQVIEDAEVAEDAEAQSAEDCK